LGHDKPWCCGVPRLYTRTKTPCPYCFCAGTTQLVWFRETQDTALTELIRVTEVLLGKNAVNAAMRKVQAVEGAGIDVYYSSSLF
jgi:hypothetical protein